MPNAFLSFLMKRVRSRPTLRVCRFCGPHEFGFETVHTDTNTLANTVEPGGDCPSC